MLAIVYDRYGPPEQVLQLREVDSPAAGRVEAAGSNVIRFRPGGEVFGWCTGALAEYVAVPEHQLEAKPAAALGHVGQRHTQGKIVITI